MSTSVLRMGLKTDLCMFPDPVVVSNRGNMKVVAINLNELINIILDDDRFDTIHLGIILEYVIEETDLL